MCLSINDFFSKRDQIRRKLRILSHLLKKFLMEIIIFCAVLLNKWTINKGAEYEVQITEKILTGEQRTHHFFQ